MNLFKKKILLNPLYKKENEARRSFIRNSLAVLFGAAVLSNAEDLFSMESKTGYIYVKQNGEVINDYQPMGDSEPYIGQINIFGFSFAPIGWAKCNGQILNINGNTALFSLLSNYYGGNGTTTFALPDFRGRIPVHMGQGSGLSNYIIGETTGDESIILQSSEIPSHTHSIGINSGIGTTPNPSNSYPAQNAEGIGAYADTPNLLLNSSAVGDTGSGNAHNNIQPVLSINFCIATQGLFPSRP